MINSGEVVFNKNLDKLDIVAHSMGYAYAVGMITSLKNAGILFGSFYILAPENACSGGANWEDFDEVWQYGADLNQPNEDPPYLQDGVAPQCAVKNIEQTMSNKRIGRVYIPKDFPYKGFLESHTVANYHWIFSAIKNPTEFGYVKNKNNN